MNYKFNPQSVGDRHDFCITVGLYDQTARVYPMISASGGWYTRDQSLYQRQVIIGAVSSWITNRVNNSLPFVSGIVSDIGEMVYHDGTSIMTTPVVQFTGVLSPLHNKDLIDYIPKAESVLIDLASALGQSTNQQRVYMSFQDRTWVMELEEEINA